VLYLLIRGACASSTSEPISPICSTNGSADEVSVLDAATVGLTTTLTDPSGKKMSTFSVNGNYFATSGVNRPPLHAQGNLSGGANGVYVYGSASRFPTSTYNSANYWVDVIFRPGSAVPAHSIFLPGSAPMAMDSADPNSAEVGVRFTTDTAGVVNGIRYYRGTTSNGGTHVGSLWDASGTKVAGATFASTTGTGWQEATLTAPVAHDWPAAQVWFDAGTVVPTIAP